MTLSRFAGPENLRLLAASNRFIQVSWLTANPVMAHGTGSKDADNVIKDGTDYQSGLMVLPTPCQVHRPSQLQAKHFSGMNDTPSRMM